MRTKTEDYNLLDELINQHAGGNKELKLQVATILFKSMASDYIRSLSQEEIDQLMFALSMHCKTEEELKASGENKLSHFFNDTIENIAKSQDLDKSTKDILDSSFTQFGELILDSLFSFMKNETKFNSISKHFKEQMDKGKK